MSQRPVLVTGATGNVGSAVVTQLLARDLPVRTAARRAGAAGDTGGRADSVVLDLTQPATFAAALAGVGRVFLVRPPAIARVGPTINAFVDAAADAGVEHIVFSSVAGAERNPVVPHHRIETHLASSGVDWTTLRPGFFAQNLATAYRHDIVEDDRIHVPAGDGRVAFVDTRDVCELAAMVLADPAPHVGRGYTLTGPRAVTFAELTEVLSEVLGRTISYEPASVVGYLRHLHARGMPTTQGLVQTVLHVGLRRGDAERVVPTLARLLGRAPRDVVDYVADHRSLW